MNRREFAIAAISSAGLLAGCDTDQKPASTATLLNNSEVQQALQSLSAAIDGLETEVGNFQSEDWRDVVPEVDSASANVRDAFNGLRKALGAPGS
jgi:outer membrane murein-binding lipoprotein Lpp